MANGTVDILGSEEAGGSQEMSKEETVEVTVKVPKRLMDMIEKEAYFGWAKEDFFVVAARSLVSGELAEMPLDKARELEAKYGEDIDVVDLSLKESRAVGDVDKTPIVRVTFEVAEWFVDFLKDYLKFLGSSWKVSDVARDAFFEEICSIRNGFANLWHQDRQDFVKKYPRIAMLDSREQQKWIAEQEKRNDC